LANGARFIPIALAVTAFRSLIGAMLLRAATVFSSDVAGKTDWDFAVVGDS
jgi:hypothetical protein